MPSPIDTPAVEVMRLKDIDFVEVTHPSAEPVEAVVARVIGDEAAEVLDPCGEIIPEEHINPLLVALLRDVEWITSLPYVGLEAEDVDVDPKLILD